MLFFLICKAQHNYHIMAKKTGSTVILQLYFTVITLHSVHQIILHSTVNKSFVADMHKQHSTVSVFNIHIPMVLGTRTSYLRSNMPTIVNSCSKAIISSRVSSTDS